SSGRYEDLMPATLSMVSATRARGDVQCLHTGEKIVQWASRQACEVQQWTASELIEGYRFERRQPGRKASTTSAFRHECCTRVLLMFETCVISNSRAWQKSHIRQPLRD